MIADPAARGRALAAFFFAVEPALWGDLEESGRLPGSATPTARREWECFALYACVRGLVAAGGFNTETAAAVDHLHDAVVARWAVEADEPEPLAARRERVADRYAEYGRIGQELESRGAHLVTARLGEAAAAHLCAPLGPPEGLAAMVGELHEALAEGAAEAVRRGDG